LDSITANLCKKYFISQHCHDVHFSAMKESGFKSQKDIGMSDEYIKASTPAVVFYWGIIATWWFGLIVGIILAIILLVGKIPTLSMKSIFILVAIMIPIVFGLSWIVGIYMNLMNGSLIYLRPGRCGAYYKLVGTVHNASYLFALVYAVSIFIVAGSYRINYRHHHHHSDVIELF
jgi:hypothetical protein